MAFMPDPATWSSKSAPEIAREFLGQDFTCPSCGRRHAVATRAMHTRPGVEADFVPLLRDLGLSGRPLVVFDRNTRAACGDSVLAGLEPFGPIACVLSRDDLHADEQALGTVLAAMQEDPAFLVSVGSGTVTDITRYNALRAGLPFVAYATAASVDGFASSVTPLIVGGFKRTYPGKAPLAILADPGVLAAAPRRMTAAGFGDVLGKVVALLDWRIAHAIEDEPHCPMIDALVDQAVKECISLSGALARSEPTAVGSLLDILALTGIAMQLMGTSRPASGGEHQISHLLEMRDIQRHRPGSLHGDKVGIGTLIGMTLYLRLFGDGNLPAQRPAMPASVWEAEVRRVFGPLADSVVATNPHEPPTGAVWEAQKRRMADYMEREGFATVQGFRALLPAAVRMVEGIGGPTRPDQLGYSVQDACDAIGFGKEVNPIKTTTLRIAERFGRLIDFAEDVSAGLPEGRVY
jgi:glycerol-1-phosphate dehydrogenase [NAD(P)+]